MKNILRSLLNFFFKVEAKIDPEASMTKGVVICNHQSFLDGLLLGLYLPQEPVFVIDRTIAERWYFKLFLRFVDHVTVDSLHPMTIKFLTREVEKGRTIVIFPEGRITLTGSFMKFYEGAAFIAHRAKAKMIPVYIDGADFTFFGRLKGIVKQRFFTPIKITMEAPIEVKIPENLFGKAKRQYLAKFTHQTLMELRVKVRETNTIFGAVLNARRDFGGSHFCAEDIRRTPETYNDLISKALGISRVLSHHTNINERVGVLLPNAIGSAAAILGLNATKRVSALLNYTAGVDGMGAAITASEIKTILTSRTFLEKGKLTYLVDAFPEINWLYAEDIRKELTLKDKLWVLKASRNPLKYLPENHPDDEAVVLFTSGSEGKPKGVVHSNRSLLTNVEQIRTIADFTSKDIFMVPLPLFHAFGLTAGMLTPLVSGSRAFFYPSPLHYRVIPELIYDLQATVLFGTSTFLQNYARFANPFDFKTLRYVVAGAEKLADSVKETWADKFGIRILEGYGATECSPVISINVPMNYKENTIGKILPGMSAKFIPVDGIETGGRLVVKGNNLMKGYLLYDQPGVLQPSTYDGEEGWYDTGDIVAMDEEGFLSIQGRAKRFAKIAGEMVSLEVTEKLFNETYGEHQHAAVIKKDKAKGEALVVFTTHPEIDRSEIAATAKRLGVTELAVAKDVRHIKALPFLGTGKTDYISLTKMAEEA